MTYQLRDYQQEIAERGATVLKELGIVYLFMEPQTGKTLTALTIAVICGYRSVLFLTKKKAVNAIINDYQKSGYEQNFRIVVINDEMMHNIAPEEYDLVIHDEHHRFGAFPKPGKHTRLFKSMFSHLPMIFLSGTPTPESYSQIYHQFWVSSCSPFKSKNFYAWARLFVNVRQKNIFNGLINDYSEARIDEIIPIISPYILSRTQQEAGFKCQICEDIIYVEASQNTYKIAKKLQSDRFIQGREQTLTADTPVKLMSLLHQIYSGTVLFDESGNGQDRVSKTLDTHKTDEILRRFNGKKIVIFYKFQAEWNAIKNAMGDAVTNSIEEFKADNDDTDLRRKSIALQVVAGREGINLREAEAIVFYNIDHSATSYWQARHRLLTFDREVVHIYWLFTRAGIEEKIYEAVVKKKNYTTSMFRRDFWKS
jgi:hypothetical protein